MLLLLLLPIAISVVPIFEHPLASSKWIRPKLLLA